MCTLLKLFKYPFLKEKSSDEVYYESIIAGCMADIGILKRKNKFFLPFNFIF
jgi:hypothetical protein